VGGHGRSRLVALRLVHPFPSFLVAVVTVLVAVLADRHASVSLFVRLGLGMLLFQFAIGIANDVVDLHDDSISKPWKPLAAGAVSRQTAVLLAAACAGAGLLVTSTLSPTAWAIGAGALFCGLAYDVYFKRTTLSWLPYAVAIPLIPAWAFTALGRWDAFLWWAFPLGALLGLSLHLANQAPDTDADRAVGIRATTQRLGARQTRAASIAIFGATASAGVVLLLFRSPERAAVAAIDGAVVFLLAPRAPAYFGRDGLFGLLAMGSAVLGAVFLSAV